MNAAWFAILSVVGFFNDKPIFLSWYWQLVEGIPDAGSRSLMITGKLLVAFLLVGQLLSISPLRRHNESLPEDQRTRLRDHLGPLVYFAGIGLGFMFIELTMLQRYLTFLGHPTYAMSVVLFSLLLSSGLGATLSDRIENPARVGLPLAAVVVGALVTAFVVPILLDAAIGWSQAARILLAGTLVAPMGLGMGMIYPLGVRLLTRDGVDHLVPWIWSINGIAGSVASVIGMMVAISQGYTVVFLLGVLAYAVTWAASRMSWRVPAT